MQENHTKTGNRWLPITLAAVILVGGLGGFLYMQKRLTNQVVTATSKLGESVADTDKNSVALQDPDLKTIIHQNENQVFLLEVETAEGKAIGSGFLYNDKGDIITNAHVVGDATQVSVKMTDSSIYPGTVIGRSGDIDIALVRVPSLAGKQPMKVAKDKKAEIGDEVIAFGSPLGLENTVTTGIISGVDRDFEIKPFKYKGMYQISAPITHGNSGGPLISKKTGEVLAVNSAGTGEGNIGFSIPVTQVVPLVQNWSENPAVAVATSSNTDVSAKAVTQTLSDSKSFKNSALQLVRYYYDNVQYRDYVAAYAVIGSEWHGQMAFDKFQTGYGNTVSVSIDNITAGEPQNDSVQVTAVIKAQERLATGENRLSYYKVSYNVGFENNKLRLLSATQEKI